MHCNRQPCCCTVPRCLSLSLHAHPSPVYTYLQAAGDDFGGNEYIRANFGSKAVDTLLHACRASPAAAHAVGADTTLLRLLPGCAVTWQNLSQMMFADVRRVGPAGGACNGSLRACL